MKNIEVKSHVKPETVQLNVELPPDVRRDFKAIAAIKGVTVKELAALALKEFCNKIKSGTSFDRWASGESSAPFRGREAQAC